MTDLTDDEVRALQKRLRENVKLNQTSMGALQFMCDAYQTHQVCTKAAEALDALLASRERERAARAEEQEACAKVADEHRARVPGHHPDEEMADKVAQGYGNAALNIAAAIRARVQQ
jgi:hypothetical protein